MQGKLYVFGSLHIDPEEKVALKPLIRDVGRSNGVIAIELESDRYTTSALKHFRNMNERQIKVVLRHQFGKREVIASYNCIKIAQRQAGIKEMVSIEPRGGTIRRLSNDIWISHKKFNKYFEYAKSHMNDEAVVDRLVRLNAEYNETVGKQSMYRETHMSRFVADVARRNPRNTLLYTSYVHAARIKEYLRKEGMRYEERADGFIHKLEKRAWRVYNPTMNGTLGHMSEAQKLESARDILESQVIWINPHNISIRQDYEIGRMIDKSVKSIRDFKEAVSNLETFKKEIRDAVL